jgi:hypothetical protein
LRVAARRGNHSIYVNRKAARTSSVPRHNEINNDLARKICRDLEVPPPPEEITSIPINPKLPVSHVLDA